MNIPAYAQELSAFLRSNNNVTSIGNKKSPQELRKREIYGVNRE